MSNSISASSSSSSCLIPNNLLKGVENILLKTDSIFYSIISEEICKRADTIIRTIYDYDEDVSSHHPYTVIPLWSSFMESFTFPNSALLIGIEMDKLIDYSCTSLLFLDFDYANPSTLEWHRQPKNIENAIFHIANHLLAWTSERPIIWDVEEIAQKAPKQCSTKIPIIIIKSASTQFPDIIKLMKLTNLIWNFASFPHLPVFVLDNCSLNQLSLLPLTLSMDISFLGCDESLCNDGGDDDDNFSSIQNLLCLSVSERILKQFDCTVDSSFIDGLKDLPLKIGEWKKMTYLSLIEIVIIDNNDSPCDKLMITRKENWELVSLTAAIWGEHFSSNLLNLFINPSSISDSFMKLRAYTANLPFNDRRSAFYKSQLSEYIAVDNSSSMNEIILNIEEKIETINGGNTNVKGTVLSLLNSTRKSCFPLVGENLLFAIEEGHLFKRFPEEHQRFRDLKAAYKIMTEHSLIINGFDWFMAWKVCISSNDENDNDDDNSLMRFLHCIYELQLMGMIKRWKKRNDIYERVYVFHK